MKQLELRGILKTTQSIEADIIEIQVFEVGRLADTLKAKDDFVTGKIDFLNVGKLKDDRWDVSFQIVLGKADSAHRFSALRYALNAMPLTQTDIVVQPIGAKSPLRTPQSVIDCLEDIPLLERVDSKVVDALESCHKTERLYR